MEQKPAICRDVPSISYRPLIRLQHKTEAVWKFKKLPERESFIWKGRFLLPVVKEDNTPAAISQLSVLIPIPSGGAKEPWIVEHGT